MYETRTVQQREENVTEEDSIFLEMLFQKKLNLIESTEGSFRKKIIQLLSSGRTRKNGEKEAYHSFSCPY